MSGDVNTALGNVVVMTGCMYTYAKIHVNTPFEFTDEGDDCFPIMNAKHRHQWASLSSVYRLYGFELRIDGEVSSIYDIRYCQTAPIMVGNEWRVIRVWEGVFTKDATCLVGRTREEFLVWLNEVGTSGSILNDGIPVFAELYALYKRMGVRGDLTLAQASDMAFSGLKQLARGMEVKGLTISHDARLQFYLITGVPPEAQMAIENEIREIDGIRFVNGPVDKLSVQFSEGLTKVIERYFK